MFSLILELSYGYDRLCNNLYLFGSFFGRMLKGDDWNVVNGGEVKGPLIRPKSTSF